MNIADNLKYVNKSASENDLWEALELANAKEFVEELPDKLNTEISINPIIGPTITLPIDVIIASLNENTFI